MAAIGASTGDVRCAAAHTTQRVSAPMQQQPSTGSKRKQQQQLQVGNRRSKVNHGQSEA